MLEAIAGHDPLDPGSAAVPTGHYRADARSRRAGLRIGFVRHFHEIDMPAEPEVTAALEHVSARCRCWAPTCATSSCRRWSSSRRSTA